MRKKILSILLILILVSSFGALCYADTQTLHTTEFTSTANVDPNTSDSLWNSTGIFKYEQDGSKVIFDSTDLKQIGEELTKINADLTKMNENVTNADTTVLERKKALATKLNALYTVINTQLSTSLPTNYSEVTTFETMAEDLETAKSMLNESLNQVFQSISEGKKQVASAITEKGVSTAADATFQVMHDNILTLATQQYQTGYANGLAAINNAKVTYTRHYHTGSSTSGGGCYTVHNIHHHTGSATVGGGCYGTPNYREDPVYGVCPGHWIKDTKSWGDKDGNGDRRYRGYCSYCGWQAADYSSWSSYPGGVGISHTSRIPTSYNKVLTGYSLSCGYQEGQDLGWSLGCGYTEGQILSATIKY